MQNNMWYTIFNLSLPATSLAVLGAMSITILFLFILKRRKWIDSFLNYFVLFILVWKFSYVLTNWQEVMNYPLSIIYFDGGTFGIALAAIILFIYSVLRVKSEKDTIQQQSFYWLSMYSSSQFLYALLNDGVLWLTILIVFFNLVILILILWQRSFEKMDRFALRMTLIYLLFTLLVEPLGFQQPKLWMILTFIVYTAWYQFKMKRSELS